jgi:hypothetical protein
MNQCACHPQQGWSIHSSCQLEAFNNDANDKSIHIPGGSQRIQTPDGCVFPLCIRDGLPHLGMMRSHTDAEFDSLPHVILTSDVDWNLRVLDFGIDDDDDWHDVISDDVNHSEVFDVFGNYKGRVDEVEASSADIWFGTVTPDQHARVQMEETTFVCSEHAHHVHHFDNDDFKAVLLANDTKPNGTANDTVKDDDDVQLDPDMPTVETVTDDEDSYDDGALVRTEPDCDKLHPLFGWMNTKTIKKTFKTTTQCAQMPHGAILKKHCKSPFPALNLKRRDEPAATDTVFSDTPAVDGGETCAQIFVCAETLVTDVHGVKNEKQFINTLEDNIRKCGAMSRLRSNRAQVEISAGVFGLLRALWTVLVGRTLEQARERGR